MNVGSYSLIAGGAGNLGRAVAQRLMDDGEEVVVIDQRACEGLATTDIVVDLADTGAAESAIAMLLSRRGAPRALVNSQGWSPKASDGSPVSAAELSVERFRQVIDINLTTCFTTMRMIAPAMARAGGGRIVNVGSAAAYTGHTTASCAYSAAKAGLAALTRAFAVEYGPSNVLVCGVSPGKFVSPGWADLADTVARYRNAIPLGRLASAGEVAELIAFLASPRNSYITGETILADGGRLA